MLRARLIAATPQSMISGLTAMVAGRFPVEGSEAHALTPVWATPPSIRGGSAMAGHLASAPAGVSAPPPSISGAASTNGSGPTVLGVTITAAAGAPVVAVQNAEIVGFGRRADLGRFIELRDAYGDTYTYAGLGRVVARYPVADPPTNSSTAPRYGNSARNASTLLAPLRKGAWVAPGTVLGNVAGARPGAQAHFLFEIRPLDAGAIDPRPILQAWRLLGTTEGTPHSGTQPLFGADATGALGEQIQLMSQSQLADHLLSSPRLRISSPCGRDDILAGRIDRPVLAGLYLLLASGLDPTVSQLECGHDASTSSASTSEHTAGEAVTISALDGIPIRGDAGPNSLAELAVRRLLALPPAIRPIRIVGPAHLQTPTDAPIQAEVGSSDRLQLGFRATQPATGASEDRAPETERPQAAISPQAAIASGRHASGEQPGGERRVPELSTTQWRRLIARISRLPEPHLPRRPTSSAVVDTPSSPPPAAESPSPALPLGGSLVPSVSAPAASHAGIRPTSRSGIARLDLGAPFSGVAGSLATPLASAPEDVSLKEPAASELIDGGQIALLSGLVELEATTTLAPSEIKLVEFEYSSDEGAGWKQISKEESPAKVPFHAVFKTGGLVGNGIYDILVKVTSTSGLVHESMLEDQLVDNEDEPVLVLGAVPKNLSGNVNLAAKPIFVQGVRSAIGPVSFELAQVPGGGQPKGPWQQIATVEESPYTTCLDSKASGEANSSCPRPQANTEDGLYDFRVHSDDEKEKFISLPVRERRIDNTPPTVSLAAPPSPLPRRVTLSASAEDSGSGVASVTFERARAGSSAFKEVGVVRFPPTPSC